MIIVVGFVTKRMRTSSPLATSLKPFMQPIRQAGHVISTTSARTRVLSVATATCTCLCFSTLASFTWNSLPIARVTLWLGRSTVPSLKLVTRPPCSGPTKVVSLRVPLSKSSVLNSMSSTSSAILTLNTRTALLKPLSANSPATCAFTLSSRASPMSFGDTQLCMPLMSSIIFLTVALATRSPFNVLGASRFTSSFAPSGAKPRFFWTKLNVPTTNSPHTVNLAFMSALVSTADTKVSASIIPRLARLSIPRMSPVTKASFPTGTLISVMILITLLSFAPTQLLVKLPLRIFSTISNRTCLGPTSPPMRELQDQRGLQD
mmetsp:Transcript_32838/g.76489  ORF Transcript_32838/g.76489 Transcript_32838/m.76489 type:complete len:319 (+) Transcript_32838:2739-3695(+)